MADPFGSSDDPNYSELMLNADRRLSLSSTISLTELTIAHDHVHGHAGPFSESPSRPLKNHRPEMAQAGAALLSNCEQTSPGFDNPRIYVGHILDPTLTAEDRKRLAAAEKCRVIERAFSELNHC